MDLQLQKKIDRTVGGALLICLKPLVMLLGLILKRDHRLEVKGQISVLKMLGGGSLVIALPALLGLRRKYPKHKMVMVTTPGIAPFAESLGLFDEILKVDQRSILRLIISSLKALMRTFRSDAFLDLEVYSRLSTVFSLLTCSRNRLGFFLESVIWRNPIHTHLIFFNRNGPIYLFYERMTNLLGARPSTFGECSNHVGKQLGLPSVKITDRVALGTGCSDLCRERAFTPEEWVLVFQKKFTRFPALASMEFEFLGSREDFELASAIEAKLRGEFPKLRIQNHCGAYTLSESLRALAASAEFWGIDSSLLHYARLFGLKITSFWGPTSPEALLKPYGLDEETHYRKVPCSPCVHVAEFPPCKGKNICMKGLLYEISDVEIETTLPYFLGE